MMREYASRIKAVVVPTLAVLLLACFLLSFRLGALSIWVDEDVSLRVAGQPTASAVVQAVMGAERRPPLYHLALHFWLELAGRSEEAGRWFSVAFALGCVSVTLLLGRELGNRQMALIVAYLLTISPFFILYGRIIRYYAFVMFLGLLSCFFFVKLLLREEHASTGDIGQAHVNQANPPHSLLSWLGYLLSTTALLYADYSALSLLLAQNLWLVIRWRTYKVLWPRWFVGQAVLAVAFIPWILVLLRQAVGDRFHADFAQSPLGALLKLAVPIYSFSVGETMFPWELPAIVGVVVCMALFGTFFVSRFPFPASRLTHQFSPSPVIRHWPFVLLCVLVPLFFTAFILSFLAPDITFLSAASRTGFAAPFFYLLMAGGLARLTRRWRLVVLVVLTLVSAYGLGNYYVGRHFLNPIYAVPLREVVQDVVHGLRLGDIVISEDDSLFSYYYQSSRPDALHFGDPIQRAEWKRAVVQGTPRVWVVTMGRDLSRLVHPPGEITGWLEAEGYQLAETHGYVPQDPLYQQLKEWALGRSAYEYKVLVELYEKSAKDPLR